MKNYFKLLKISRTIYFLEVILGYLFIKSILFDDFTLLFLTFISLSICIYPAIYAFNDLIDYKSDKEDKIKKNRLIASGKISIKYTFIFIFLHLMFGFILGYFININLFYLEIIFLLFNILYTLILKKIPYLEFFSNGFTHVLRFVTGIILAKGSLNFFISFIIGYFIFSILFSTIKRYYEFKNNSTRSTLKYYSTLKFNLFYSFLITIYILNYLYFQEYILMFYVGLLVLLFFIIFTQVSFISKKLESLFLF